MKSKMFLAVISLVAVIALFINPIVGVAMATLVAGAAVTPDDVRTNVSTLDMEDISKSVTEILPARVPLNKIMREIRKARKVNSEIIRYYSVVNKDLYDIPDDDASGAGTSVSVPAEAYTYASGPGLTSIWVQVTNPDLWAKGDTAIAFQVHIGANIAASKTYYEDIMFWVKTKTGNVLQLVPLNGTYGINSGTDLSATYVVPDFAKTQKFYIAGNAKESTAMQAEPFAVLPTAQEQYCQNFMAQIEEATFQALTQKEVQFGFADYEKQNIWQMAVKQELSFLYGVKAHLYDSTNANYRYTTEGITRQITTDLEYGTGSLNTDVSQSDYLTWMETVFTGNNGSDKRILFAGAGLMTSLHVIDEYTKQLTGTNTTLEWGVKFTKIVSDFGELLVAQHPLFAEIGLSDYGLILDPAHIEKNDFVPMSVTELDLKKAGTRNVTAKVIQEVSALTLTNPTCHAIIRPKA